MSTKPIFMATHPRACSTAFERVFMTRRDDLQCVHEPFGDAFYYGPERMGTRWMNDEKIRVDSGFIDSNYKTILDRIDRENSEGKRVFIKDITYYLVPPEKQAACIAPSLHNLKRKGVGTEQEQAPRVDSGKASPTLKTSCTIHDSGVDLPNVGDVAQLSANGKDTPFPYGTVTEPNNPTVVPRELLEQFHFTFLIRHPRSSIPSYYRCCIPPLVEKTGFHAFQPNEAGYDELRRFFDYCKDSGLVGPSVCGQGEEGTAKATANGADKNASNVEICVIDADDLLDDPEGILRKYCASIGVEWKADEMLNWSQDDQDHALEMFEKWTGFHEDAIHSNDLKPRQHKKKPKSDEQLMAEWKEKFGDEAAAVIAKTVEENVADYEYLKQFAIKA